MVSARPLSSQLLVVEVCQNELLTRPVRTLNTLIQEISLFPLHHLDFKFKLIPRFKHLCKLPVRYLRSLTTLLYSSKYLEIYSSNFFILSHNKFLRFSHGNLTLLASPYPTICELIVVKFLCRKTK